MVGFLFGGSTGLSYQDLQSRREAADALAKRIMGMQPRNVPEGIGALLTGVAAGIGRHQANKGMKEGRDAATGQFNKLFSQITGQPIPDNQVQGTLLPNPGAAAEMTATSPASGMEPYRNAIASIESAGSGDYAAVGPTHQKLGRALGRYQIMETNIGPWSREVLGREVTPDEFMANPQLQDAIFDGKFGQYVQQYGPEGAAQAWFGGPGGVGKTDRRDSLGTTIGAYTNKFTNALGGTQVASLDPSAGMSASAAIEQQAPGSGYVDPMVSATNSQQAYVQPQQAAGALPPLPSREVASPPPVATPPQQVAQAGPPTMPRPQPYRPNPQMLQLLSNPFLDESQKSVLQMMMRQEMEQHELTQQEQLWRARQDYDQWQRQSDPAYRLGLQQTQAEIERMQQPGYRMLTADERKAYGIPDYDNRPYQITREGQVSAVGGAGQMQSAGVEAAQRESLARQYGIDPNSAEGQRFILTGTLPASDRGVTAGDREAIREAEDNAFAAQNVVDQLESVLRPDESGLSLNDRAGYGASAGWQSWAARNDPTGFFDDAKGEATTELTNTVLNQALSSLKSIFGGNPTEGERAILMDLQASVDKTPAERKIIIDKAIKQARKKLAYSRDRADELRGGTYYRPRQQGAPVDINGYKIEQVD